MHNIKRRKDKCWSRLPQ